MSQNLTPKESFAVMLFLVPLFAAEESAGFGLGMGLSLTITIVVSVAASGAAGMIATAGQSALTRAIGTIGAVASALSGYFAVTWFLDGKKESSNFAIFAMYGVALVPAILVAIVLVRITGGFDRDLG
jgi:undecaprenyl pyrophosphate phosphatase UppP